MWFESIVLTVEYDGVNLGSKIVDMTYIGLSELIIWTYIWNTLYCKVVRSSLYRVESK